MMGSPNTDQEQPSCGGENLILSQGRKCVCETCICKYVLHEWCVCVGKWGGAQESEVLINNS